MEKNRLGILSILFQENKSRLTSQRLKQSTHNPLTPELRCYRVSQSYEIFLAIQKKFYDQLTTPLMGLLKKVKFEWHSQAEAYFQRLKEILTTILIIRTPNFIFLFIIECDASSISIGIRVVLMQERRHITFERQKLNIREQLKQTYNKVMLAVLHKIYKWQQYLFGNKFMAQTNHNNLQQLLHLKVLSPKQQEWVSKRQALDFEIVHRKGVLNTVVDALSQCDEDTKLQAISTMEQGSTSRILSR